MDIEKINISYRKDRSFLYGMLLAVADKVEQITYRKDDNRLTNAMRYMNVFSQRPSKTWGIIHDRLTPYWAKLYPSTRKKYQDFMAIIHASFKPGDFESDDKLDPKYLLGFYCQRNTMLKEKELRENEQEANEINQD